MSEAPDIAIIVNEMDGGGWECEVDVRGESVGGGTGPTASSALDVAMDILYGDKNDWLNGWHGHMAQFGAGGA